MSYAGHGQERALNGVGAYGIEYTSICYRDCFHFSNITFILLLIINIPFTRIMRCVRLVV